jgi:uncharacterized protein
MSQTLPLFPLGTVLYPGLLLPLHIFEDRYRRLVKDLLDGPEPRRFGVIAIRKGRETGVEGVAVGRLSGEESAVGRLSGQESTALYEVGCTATLRRVVEQDDGRYELVTAGTQRFRLGGLDDSLPYLQGEVEFLDEPIGDEAAAAQAVQVVQRAFGDYLAALSERGAQVRVPDLPDEPVLLSYLVAAAIVADLPDRQGLLAQPDALSRLEAERALLGREAAMLRTFTSAPAPDLRNTPFNPN